MKNISPNAKHDEETANTVRIVKLVMIFLLGLPLFGIGVNAQRPTPEAGPDDSAARMYSLDDVYQRVDVGASASLPAGFTEPTGGPTVSSGIARINELMGILPEVDDMNCAEPDEVVGGRTFFSLCSSSWGNQAGIAADWPLAATGQVTCYDSSGAVINCDGTGQDADYLFGSTADPRFVDNGDGTITDNLTSLTWLRNASCFGTRNWETALNDANTLASGACGLSDGSSAGDWRLPNRRELGSLIDYQRNNPALPSDHPFTNVASAFYFTSTTTVSSTANAWYINLASGLADGTAKTNSNNVWPVK